MEEILAIRKKNLAHSPSNIKELLAKISNVQIEKEKYFHKLEEDELRICKLSKEVTALENELQIEKQNLEEKVTESERHSYLLQDLKKDKENQELSFAEIDKKYKTMKKIKPSVKDCELLERGKRKLKLYKEFTGIRWDYSTPEGVLEGYITDKKEFLQPISFKNISDYKTVREALWESIHQSTMDNTGKEDVKENKPVN